MALNPIIARGVTPIDVSGTLADIAQMRQRDRVYAADDRRNALYEQKYQAEQQAAMEQRQQQVSERDLRDRYAEMVAIDSAPPEYKAQWVQMQAQRHPEFAQTPFAQMPPEQAFAGMKRGIEARLGIKPETQNIGSVVKMADGTYATPSQAVGQPFWQEPDQSRPTEAPSDQRLYQWFSGLSPEEQAAYLNMKRSSATPEAAAAIAGAKATATEGAKARAEATANLPKAEGAAQMVLGTIQNLRSNKGTRFLYGGYALAPITPGTAQAEAASYLDQLGGQAFLQAFESLKGGGHITEIEGTKATQALTRLTNRRISYGSALRAMKEFEDNVKLGLQKARQRAGVGAPSNAAAPADNDPLGLRK